MNITKLKEDQLKLARKIITKDAFEKLELVAGVDQAIKGENLISVVVVCEEKTIKEMEKVSAEKKAPMPYVPGYLSYREGPVIVESYLKLKQKPDVLMVDGNGILHPRRFGMACHIGLLLDIPTIGISKKLLCGDMDSDGKIIVDKEVVGQEILTKEHGKPIYVSPGHRISLKTAVEIVRKSVRPPHKLPEPLHLAHKYAKHLAGHSGKEEPEE